MKVLVSSKKKVIDEAVSLVVEQVKKNPSSVLGLATGKTMVPFYSALVKICKKEKISFSRVRTFNLDEYAGLKKNDWFKESFHFFMCEHFFNKVNIKQKNTFFPSASNVSRYDEMILEAGGLDICVLGIGRNEHIAFNEPGSKFSSRTRKVKLSDETIKFNGLEKFGVGEAYTIGLGTIMKSKKILLLAFGKEKAKVVGKAFNGDVCEDVPASVLRKHKDVNVFVDKWIGKFLI